MIDEIGIIFDYLDYNKKNIFSQTCTSIHKNIYIIPKNKIQLASFYINKTLEIAYNLNIPLWFINKYKPVFNVLNNMFIEIIKGDKMIFKVPTIHDFLVNYNYDFSGNIYNKLNTNDIFRIHQNNNKEFEINIFSNNDNDDEYMYMNKKKKKTVSLLIGLRI